MKAELAASVAILITASVTCSADSACVARSGSNRVPLVELYTSEGCSSCPPADRWLSSQIGRADINLLAFHVDYWDYIGWQDRFALPGNSDRQRKRVNALGGDTVYTPQVMVGTRTRVSWNSGEKFESALLEEAEPSVLDLELELVRHDGTLEVRIDSGDADSRAGKIQVWLARTLDDQSTIVRGGENRGATLKHDGIVTKLWGPWSPPVAQTLPIEEPLDGEKQWNLVAFAQDVDGRTLQSLALHADKCLKFLL